MLSPYLVVLYVLFSLNNNCNSLLSDGNSSFNAFAYGPGLQPTVTYPAYYFFIQATNGNYVNYTESPGRIFDVKISGRSGDNKRECRIHYNILDRKDGSFIVRYKLHEVCFDLLISIRYNNTHVADSPYMYKGMVFPEDCSCYQFSTSTALRRYKCEVREQILLDLKPFQRIDMKELFPVYIKWFGNSTSTSVCNYVIITNKIYRKCYGMYTDFKMFVDAILLSLTRKTSLKDTEFFVNIGDWPQIKTPTKPLLPLFSWCGSLHTSDIVMPTYEITESTLQNMGRVSVDMLSVQGNIEYTWGNKIPKAFWRGRDSSAERLKLVKIARRHEDLFNASITNFFFFTKEMDEYGPKVQHESFFKFFNYKYQIIVDGTVAAYRFPFLLAGDSVILKQKSDYYEHFYRETKPWKHYIPVKHDLSDLVEKVQWAIDNDEQARNISLAGQTYARENLMPQNILCYYMELLHEYSKLVASEVHIRDGMELVPQLDNSKCHCDKMPGSQREKDEL